MDEYRRFLRHVHGLQHGQSRWCVHQRAGSGSGADSAPVAVRPDDEQCLSVSIRRAGGGHLLHSVCDKPGSARFLADFTIDLQQHWRCVSNFRFRGGQQCHPVLSCVGAISARRGWRGISVKGQPGGAWASSLCTHGLTPDSTARINNFKESVAEVCRKSEEWGLGPPDEQKERDARQPGRRYPGRRMNDQNTPENGTCADISDAPSNRPPKKRLASDHGAGMAQCAGELEVRHPSITDSPRRPRPRGVLPGTVPGGPFSSPQPRRFSCSRVGNHALIVA